LLLPGKSGLAERRWLHCVTGERVRAGWDAACRRRAWHDQL